MTPVQWLAVALAVTATHVACFFWGLECARRVVRQAVYDLGYQDGVDNRHRRPSSVDATVGPTRLRTLTPQEDEFAEALVRWAKIR